VVAAGCAGCGPSAKPVVISNPVASPVGAINPVCPEELREYSWNRELFPGCPPRPFWWLGTTCSQTACPTPCRDVSTERGRVGPVAARHRYENGQWVGTERGWTLGSRVGEFAAPDEPPPGGHYCTRAGDRGSCDVIRHDRRITQAKLRFNDAGDPIKISLDDDRPITFEWAAGHQLVKQRVAKPGDSFTEYRYTYDERGRLARVTSSGWGFTQDARYAYGANGLVSSIEIDYTVPSHFTFTFEYDAEQRPVHIVWTDAHQGVEPISVEQRYEYNCPAPRPFAEAVPVLERFKQEACACSDHACTERVRAELASWRSGVTDPVGYLDKPDPVAGPKFLQLEADIQGCAR
jgi:hypothetical protein